MQEKITPVHIQLKEGEIAERVLIAGDPQRINEISGLLDDARLQNSYRYTVYTGEYKGVKVTLASHGMGAPSIAIAVEELHALGGKKFIRLGTCGGLRKDEQRGDWVIPDAAVYSGGGTIGAYVGDSKKSFKPDAGLTSKLLETAKLSGNRCFTGPVLSKDAFYSGAEDALQDKTFVGQEMEGATLFMLGELRGFEAASLLLVVDNPSQNLAFLPIAKMHEIAKDAAKTVLDALTAS